jgi:hypothetical protein
VIHRAWWWLLHVAETCSCFGIVIKVVYPGITSVFLRIIQENGLSHRKFNSDLWKLSAYCPLLVKALLCMLYLLHNTPSKARKIKYKEEFTFTCLSGLKNLEMKYEKEMWHCTSLPMMSRCIWDLVRFLFWVPQVWAKFLSHSMCWEMFTFCSEIETEHLNTPCGPNVDFLSSFLSLLLHEAIAGLSNA